MAVIAIAFVSCEKEDNINPSPVQSTQEDTSELPPSFKTISVNNKALGDGTGFCFDKDAAPGQDACPEGEGTCIGEVEVKPGAVGGLSGAIVDGDVPNFLTPSTISTLSAGSTFIQNELMEVDNGNKKIIEVVMPNATGSRRAFLIGDFSITLNANNCDVAIVYEI